MIERVTFPCGDLTLEGFLEGPDGAVPWGGAVFCHPHPLYGGTMHNNVVARVTPALARAGLAVLRFNFRGVERSQGTFADGVGERDDLRAALAFLAGRDGLAGRPLAALGYSFGAAVVAQAACAQPHVNAVVCIALPVGFAGFGPFDELRACRLPKLFLAGSADDVCPPPRLRELVGALPDPKTLVVLDGTDHFFHGREPDLASHITPFVSRLHPEGRPGA
ncbi:MAG TPA: alpha/beta fold hydrolase [Candidatus Methylomirabilis sp.]|jgi:alpha/beta superfamily hydrolase